MNTKVSIIAEGGGMRGAYALGVIFGLYFDFGLRRVDVVTGSSASIGTLAYFTAGQFFPGFYIWPEKLPNKKFLSFRNILQNKPLLNVEYLVDEIFKNEIPLDMSKLLNSKVELIIPLTNAKTGEFEYASSKNKFSNYDPREVLKAAMAVPVLFGKVVKLKEKDYYDGWATDTMPLEIDSVIDSTKIIIFTKPFELNSNLKELDLYNLRVPHFGLLYGNAIKQIKKCKQAYNEKLKLAKKLEEKGDILIYPKNKFSKINNSRKNINKCIEEGRRDVINNPKIQELMKKLRNSPRAKFYFEE